MDQVRRPIVLAEIVTAFRPPSYNAKTEQAQNRCDESDVFTVVRSMNQVTRV